ncbi:hypothetical protein [Moraxella oculi]|uniref:Uncharacterized protein n=1 Tax=Moraxella oculi TaxID=2940516 RepID=A0ABW8UAK9_9GAMM
MNKNYTILAHCEQSKTSLDDIVNVMGILYDYTAKDNPLFERERINSLVFILWERLETAKKDLQTALELLEQGE